MLKILYCLITAAICYVAAKFGRKIIDKICPYIPPYALLILVFDNVVRLTCEARKIIHCANISKLVYKNNRN